MAPLSAIAFLSLFFSGSLSSFVASESTASAIGRAPDDAFDVLVYGSTPSGIVAAIAAARHLPSPTAADRRAAVGLISQRPHVGGACAGGLGKTDVGTCADEVIGGVALEFFRRNRARYAEPPQPGVDAWNLEPHVAGDVFLEMLEEADVKVLPHGEVASVSVGREDDEPPAAGKITQITTVDGSTYAAKVFIDASYEGDLMARTPGVGFTWGRESSARYGEPGAGSLGPQRTEQYGGVDPRIDPFDSDGRLLPLLREGAPGPVGAADRKVQAYNFRLCVTDDPSLRVPFDRPDDYDPGRWEVLRRFWTNWPNSTNPHKRQQAQVPTAILQRIPSSRPGVRKYDMNNCGYNPVHTDMIGNSWEYPNANYERRKEIWNEHVSYTRGFLWFMSSDDSVPEAVRSAYRHGWGYCGDEFNETGGFPPQLYVREARRLVGEEVFTQNDVTNQKRHGGLGNASIGMGCYNFDSHCADRYACTNMTECTLHREPYVAWDCGVVGFAPNRDMYQMPLSLLLPKASEATNLLVPVCSSASHVAYSTVRMEPQFMILGHSAGVVAALSVNASAAVQDVDRGRLHELLLADGQILSSQQFDGAATVSSLA